MEQLWKRFLGGVLPESHAREKWHTPSENLEVGNLVLVLKPWLHDQKCELGVVGKVQTGTYNLVRNATVRTGRGIFKRANTHLIPLPRKKPEDLTGED